MIVVVSPAKSINSTIVRENLPSTVPNFAKKANAIAKELRMKSVDDLMALFGVSRALAELNFERYRLWHKTVENENALQSILAFNGEVYRGINVENWSVETIASSQDYIRILSGLYGLLNPLDLIQPYRLEMGTKWGPGEHTSLYSFWHKMVTEQLNRDIADSQGDKILINAASAEYFKVIDKKKLKFPVLTVDFRQEENGKLKNITVYTKKARGLMARFITEQKITKSTDLQAFDYEGYTFSAAHSLPDKWIYIR